MRTYAGHSTAEASNELYRRNLAKGQTGLSVAFDLPTQTGYDPDHILARGEVGRVGVPVSHLGDMRALFQDIPLDQMNTSMTINATAMWLLALYQVVAEEQGADITKLQGTTQNDIVKEYLSRGTHVFPPGPSLRLTTDMIAYTVAHIPKWNPINICSYHLQEAGATPVQEIAYAMSTAIAVLDAVRDSGQVPPEQIGDVVARISFFVNAGVRFVEEMCKMRAFAPLWDQVTRERYGIDDPKQRRFRYGVQVNSLGLTEAQPENNVQRIVLEMLAVTLSKDARARAVQLPAWNEALGLPRPWDQQWSLRIQQVLAHESDLLEYEDIFDGSHVVEAKIAELLAGAEAEIDRVQEMGGAIPAVESGYLKSQLVASHAARRARIESGAGQDRRRQLLRAPPSPTRSPRTSTPRSSRSTRPTSGQYWPSLGQWREQRDETRGARRAATGSGLTRRSDGVNLMAATLECARAGVTTGEWSFALRDVFGEYRAPTGVSSGPVAVAAEAGGELAAVRAAVAATAEELGAARLRLLVGKPGLDGHSNGAEQIAVRARDAGFEVIYQGIRLTPEQIVAAAVAEDVHCVGLSILSGSHAELVPDVLHRLRQAGAEDLPVVVGGIIPAADAEALRAAGVAAVFTPKDFGITAIIGRIVDEIRLANKLAACRASWPQAEAMRTPLRRAATGRRKDPATDPTMDAPTCRPSRRHRPSAPPPLLPGRPRQQPALPGEGPGPARGPGLPGPRGRLRAAGQGERPAQHRRRAEQRRLERQDPRRPGQRLDHPLDLPGRDHGGRGRWRQPGLHHAAEGAGRRAGHGAGPAAHPDREDDGLRGRPDRHRGPDRERQGPGERRRDRRRLAAARDHHLRPGRLHGLDQHEVAGGRRAAARLPGGRLPLHPDAHPDGGPQPTTCRRSTAPTCRSATMTATARSPGGPPPWASTASGCCTRTRSPRPTRSSPPRRRTTTTRS